MTCAMLCWCGRVDCSSRQLPCLPRSTISCCSMWSSLLPLTCWQQGVANGQPSRPWCQPTPPCRKRSCLPICGRRLSASAPPRPSCFFCTRPTECPRTQAHSDDQPPSLVGWCPSTTLWLLPSRRRRLVPTTRRSADPDRRPQLHISGHGREPMATPEACSGIRSISAVVACGRGHRRHVGGSRHRGRSTCRVADTRAVPVPRRRSAWAAVGGGDFKRWVRPPTQLSRAPSHPRGPGRANGGLRGWSVCSWAAPHGHIELIIAMLSTGGSWAQRVVCGAVGRPHGGSEPRLGLWGDPLATGMPAWVVVGLNGAHLLNPLISPCLISKPAPPTPAPAHSGPKTPLCAHTAVF